MGARLNALNAACRRAIDRFLETQSLGGGAWPPLPKPAPENPPSGGTSGQRLGGGYQPAVDGRERPTPPSGGPAVKPPSPLNVDAANRDQARRQSNERYAMLEPGGPESCGRATNSHAQATIGERLWPDGLGLPPGLRRLPDGSLDLTKEEAARISKAMFTGKLEPVDPETARAEREFWAIRRARMLDEGSFFGRKPPAKLEIGGTEYVRGDVAAAPDGSTLEQLFGAIVGKLDPDPGRSGIAETPGRVANAWRYWCGGYTIDVDDLFKSFEDGAEGYDEMVIVSNIPVLSHCEHHMAAISGFAHVGYIPNGRVVGLSKIARVVDALSRRLQVQERLTVQIADAVARNLNPHGVGVVIKASHGCMSSRGVKIHGSLTTTSALRGSMKNETSARAEFLALCAAAEKGEQS